MNDKHNPGGKVVLPMIPGVTGDAYFTPCDRYRIWLSREWGFRQFSDGREPYALWIGMNPSTAGAKADDPTIRKEIKFTNRFRLDKYVKVNVMDYRATNPRDLLTPGIEPRSPENLDAIKKLADRASIIVCCWGRLHSKLRHYADECHTVLAGRSDLWCLGLNADGSPKHPLYVPDNTRLIPYII